METYYRPRGRQAIGARRDQYGQPEKPVRQVGLSAPHDWSAFDAAFPKRPVQQAAPVATPAPAAPRVPQGVAGASMMGAAGALGAYDPSPMNGARPAATPAVRSPRPQIQTIPAPASAAQAALVERTPSGGRDANGSNSPRYMDAAIARTDRATAAIAAERGDAFASQIGAQPAPAVGAARVALPSASYQPVNAETTDGYVGNVSTPAFGNVQVAPGRSQTFQTPYGTVTRHGATQAAPGAVAGVAGSVSGATAVGRSAPVAGVRGAAQGATTQQLGSPAAPVSSPSRGAVMRAMPPDAFTPAQPPVSTPVPPVSPAPAATPVQQPSMPDAYTLKDVGTAAGYMAGQTMKGGSSGPGFLKTTGALLGASLPAPARDAIRPAPASANPADNTPRKKRVILAM